MSHRWILFLVACMLGRVVDLPAQKPQVLHLPQPELEMAFQSHVEPLQKAFHAAEKGQGTRTDKLEQLVRIDFQGDGKTEVLMIYQTAIEHARGGDETYAIAVWSEAKKKILIGEKDLGAAPMMSFWDFRDDLVILDPNLPRRSRPERGFLWYNLRTGTLREGRDLDHPPGPPVLKFALQDDGASDIWWELQDGNGEPVPLPNAVRLEIGELRYVPPALLEENRFAVWFLGEKLRILDIEAGTVTTLMSLYPDMEGISGFAIAPGEPSRIAFANLNPGRYEHNAMIFVLDLKDGRLLRKQKFNADLHYGFKGNSIYNNISAGEDFWFKTRDRIEYRENPMTTDPRLEFGEWDVTTYPFQVRGIELE